MVIYMCVRDIAFSYFYDFSIECLELFRRCDTFFSFYYRLWKKNYDDESATGPPREILQGGTILRWGLRTGWNFSQDCGFELNVPKNNEKIKIKLQWLRLWGPSEIHGSFRGFPFAVPMYRLNPPLICPAFYHPRFCREIQFSILLWIQYYVFC